MKLYALIFALLVASSGPAFAEPAYGRAADEKAEAEKPAKSVPEPVMFKSTHTGTFGGQKITYRLEAGETHIRNAESEPGASLFTISYIRENVSGPRPVSFVFNGGPGSASV